MNNGPPRSEMAQQQVHMPTAPPILAQHSAAPQYAYATLPPQSAAPYSQVRRKA